MTAYSFGNRWVGITALRTPPPPEPLHKMAIRLRLRALARTIRINREVSLPVAETLASLSGIRIRMALSGMDTRSQECLAAERSIRSGRTPTIRPWMLDELSHAHSHNRDEQPEKSTTARTTRLNPPPEETIVSTGWAATWPEIPDSPWLPPASKKLVDDLQRIDLTLREDALRWVRWACVHRSYQYESIPDSPVGAEVLDMLAALGQGWMRLALLDRIRSQRGDFASNAEVSAILTQDYRARTMLGAWVNSTGSASYGKGETSQMASGKKSNAPAKVAMQILGALSLITASQGPADSLLELVAFEADAPEPDWRALLVSQVKREPTFTHEVSGPDHDRQFAVTAEAVGRTASGTATSLKAARRMAIRSYVLQHLPWAVPADSGGVGRMPKPSPYRRELPAHVRARRWLQQAFEVADAGLISQTLTHRSWTYENPSLVEEAGQRDYGTLATEGAEAIANVIRHQYTLTTLGASFRIPASAVTSPALPKEMVAELFDRMRIADGVLRSSGTDLTGEIKEDVTQSVIGAAWRANGDLLMERQPETFARWVRAFTPAPDPSTRLQEYCARVKATYSVEFERRGPDHRAEFRATITFELEGHPRWRGGWRSASTPAKQSAAADALRCLSGQEITEEANSDDDSCALLRAMLLAELRTIDPSHVDIRKDLIAGRLGIDLLVTGAYGEYLHWARARSQLLPSTGSAVASRLTDYYVTALEQQRRAAIRQWIVENTPTYGIEVTDFAERIHCWQESRSPGLLALFEEILSLIEDTEAADAILVYVELKADTIATTSGTALESEQGVDETAHTLTLRVPGIELSTALAPVVGVIDCIFGGVSWEHESHAVSVTVPIPPIGADPVSRAGAEAVRRALRDPWLQHVQTALHDFLSAVERSVVAAGNPSPALLDSLRSSERSLIEQLRFNG
ncbi:putative dsRNA-binding protein [Nocardia sp. NPDC003693]